MKAVGLAVLLLFCCVGPANAAVHYVNSAGSSPAFPFTDWSTAATNIQDAIDASTNGDTILVTNGIYQWGGRPATFGTASSPQTNRVLIEKPVTVASVNGSEVTTIVGSAANPYPVRCAYLTNGAVLTGFTLRNGWATNHGKGYAGGVFCQSSNATVNDCVLTGNFSDNGGGAYQGTLNRCLLTGNAATTGGGAAAAILNNCALTANQATGGNYYGLGGAAFSCTLNNCTVTGNSANSGGGTYLGSLNNCIIYFNKAYSGTNCYGGTLNNCCTTPAPTGGAGNITSDPLLASATHLGSISPCRAAGSPSYSSGTDLDGEAWGNPPDIGCDEFVPGNVTGPLTVSIDPAATNVAVAHPADLTGIISGKPTASVWNFGDGTLATNQPYGHHAWTTAGDYTVVLTAYNEDHPDGISATQSMQVGVQMLFYVSQGSLNPVPPYATWATAATDIQSAVDLTTVAGQWVLVSNGVYQTGGRLVPGSTTTNRLVIPTPILVSSVNGPLATTIQGSGGGIGSGAVRCAYLGAAAQLVGFTLSGGATASGEKGGGVRCAAPTSLVAGSMFVGNVADLGGGGIYAGTASGCYFWGNTSESWGGASDSSTLNNCTLVGNVGKGDAGGAYGGTLNNCFLTQNVAPNDSYNEPRYGGGAENSTLNNCILTQNAAASGGGAYACTLNNCTVEENTAYDSAGGALMCTLRNTIIYYNQAPQNPNLQFPTASYCCSPEVPGPGSGDAASAGNITNAPAFANQAGGDLHLQSNSPCINAGNNAYVVATWDYDGSARVAGGTVDLGAYEVPSPASTLSYAWAQRYGVPTDGSADLADVDHDGMNNWQEWRTGTDPTDSTSVLYVMSPASTNNGSGILVTWKSLPNVSYSLQRSGGLLAPPSFSTLQSNIIGQAGVTSFWDAAATNAGPYFYRVGVQ